MEDSSLSRWPVQEREDRRVGSTESVQKTTVSTTMHTARYCNSRIM